MLYFSGSTWGIECEIARWAVDSVMTVNEWQHTWFRDSCPSSLCSIISHKRRVVAISFIHFAVIFYCRHNWPAASPANLFGMSAAWAFDDMPRSNAMSAAATPHRIQNRNPFNRGAESWFCVACCLANLFMVPPFTKFHRESIGM